MRIYHIKRDPKSPLLVTHFEPLERYNIVFPRIQNPPVRRVYVYRPVEVWDLYLFTVDRVFKTNFGLKYKIVPLSHKLWVILNLDVKQDVARLFSRVPGLFPETVAHYDIALLYTLGYPQLQVEYFLFTTVLTLVTGALGHPTLSSAHPTGLIHNHGAHLVLDRPPAVTLGALFLTCKAGLFQCDAHVTGHPSERLFKGHSQFMIKIATTDRSLEPLVAEPPAEHL